MRTIVIGLFLALAAACGSTGGVCNLKQTPKQDACDPGVVPNASAKACKDSTGSDFICRDGLGYCVVCNGGAFSDGCTITDNGTDSYCIHDCSNC